MYRELPTLSTAIKLYEIANRYFENRCYDEAFEKYEEVIKMNYAPAMNKCAEMLYRGYINKHGIMVKNENQAKVYYNMSAELGNKNAKEMLKWIEKYEKCKTDGNELQSFVDNKNNIDCFSGQIFSTRNKTNTKSTKSSYKQQSSLYANNTNTSSLKKVNLLRQENRPLFVHFINPNNFSINHSSSFINHSKSTTINHSKSTINHNRFFINPSRDISYNNISEATKELDAKNQSLKHLKDFK